MQDKQQQAAINPVCGTRGICKMALVPLPVINIHMIRHMRATICIGSSLECIIYYKLWFFYYATGVSAGVSWLFLTRFWTSFISELVWLEEQHAERAHTANTGGGFIGIFMISITTSTEQIQEPTVIPSLLLLIGSPDVDMRAPNIFTIAQQKLFRRLSYSLVRKPVFP